MIKKLFSKFGNSFSIFRIRLHRKNSKKFYKLSQKYWAKKGVVFKGDRAIAFYTANLDCSVPNMITIGDETTITARVTILVHDYSIQHGLSAINKDFPDHIVQHVAPVVIGKNCFIGNDSILLPGTTIGDNCIIGAGSVVRGNIPDNSVVCGNPAKVIANTIEWASKKDDNYYVYGGSWGNFPKKKKD